MAVCIKLTIVLHDIAFTLLFLLLSLIEEKKQDVTKAKQSALNSSATSQTNKERRRRSKVQNHRTLLFVVFLSLYKLVFSHNLPSLFLPLSLLTTYVVSREYQLFLWAILVFGDSYCFFIEFGLAWLFLQVIIIISFLVLIAVDIIVCWELLQFHDSVPRNWTVLRFAMNRKE